MNEIKQNQTERIYENLKGFELRLGKFYNPNEYLDGIKFEIRILNHNNQLIEVLYEKIKEWLSN